MSRIVAAVACLLIVLAVGACGATPLVPTPAPSEAPPTDLGGGADVSIGVSLPAEPSDQAEAPVPAEAVVPDPFLDAVMAAATARAGELGSVELHVAGAGGKAATQLEQVQAFVDGGVDALVVVPVDATATGTIEDLATSAGVPLVWLNRRPDELPSDGSTPFVGSDELAAGTLEMQALSDRLDGRGNIVILMGDPATEPAVDRTEGCKDVIAQHPGLRLVREQAAGGSRLRAHEILTAWLADETTAIDGVCANDDELALGALDALDEAGRAGVAVGGIGGMADAVEAIEAGRLATTVFQDAAWQGQTAVDTAVALARGRSVETVEGSILLPGELVTQANATDYAGRNVPPAPTE